MTYHIGVVMNAGKHIVVKTDSEAVFKSTLEALEQKDTTLELEQGGMCVKIRTPNIAKIVTYQGEDFNILDFL